MIVSNGYVIATTRSDEQNAVIMQKIQNKPTDPEGFQYKLRADNLEWELVELPPVPEYEPTAEDKAEAYDILMGVSE
jgi:hypothetical protein